MRPFSHRTNYQRVVISSANDFFFFHQSKFSQLFPRPTILCQVTKSFVPWQLSFVGPSYFGSMTHWSSFNWDVSGNTKNRVSQMRTRRRKMGDYKIVTFLFLFVCFGFVFVFFFFFGKRQTLSFVAVQTGLNASRVPVTVLWIYTKLSLQNYVINTLKTLWRRTNNAFL